MNTPLVFCFRLTVTILTTIVLISCSASRAYDGPVKSQDEVAQVRSYGVTFRSIDGKPIGSSTSSVDILPGIHTITVTPNASNYGMLRSKNSTLIIKMEAEAGKIYAITSKRGNRTLCAFECISGSSKPDFQKPAGCAVHPSLVNNQ
jgi:hypothetical protein